MLNDLLTKPAVLDRRIPGHALNSLSGLSGKAIGVAAVPDLHNTFVDVTPADIYLLERLLAGIKNIGVPNR